MQVVQTLEADDSSLLLQVTVLMTNTPLVHMADARAWLIEHEYLAQVLCTKCGGVVDPPGDFKVTLTDEGAVTTCATCRRRLHSV